MRGRTIMSKVYAPGSIGNMEIRNRFVMTAVNLFYCKDGYINDRVIEFYRARAKGGVGLIVAGVVAVDNEYFMDAADPSSICIHDDSYVPGLRKLTDAVHAEGAKIFPQLWHMGAYASSRLFKDGRDTVGPSPVPSNYSRQTPRELTIPEIERIIDCFGKGAKRAKEAGFDGVELVGSAGYLISQFLSSKTNKRTDKYGGDLQGRMTFLLEIVAKVQENVGDFPIMVRLSGNEFVPEGNSNPEAVEIAIALEHAGISAINVTGGWHETGIPQLTMDVPAAAYLYLAKQIRAAVNIPVVSSNRFDASTAEKVIDSGEMDFIGVCRALIADPAFVSKAQRGDYDLIRPCIGCNQGCMDNVFKDKSLTCLVNPEAGREAELLAAGKLHAEIPVQSPEHILVVGAGAAGMEYAKVAANKGNTVTVWEASDSYGGQLLLAGAPHDRHDFYRLNNYLYRACEAAGVSFVFGKRAAADEIVAKIEDGSFDRVVLATGAEPITPHIEIEAGANVVQAWDVLLGKVGTGKNVVVVGGGAAGVETAVMLAQDGTLDSETYKFLSIYRAEEPKTLYKLLTTGNKRVSLLEMQKKMGADIGPSSRWIMVGNLKRYHVDTYNLTKVLYITKEGVVCENVESGEPTTILADTVVLAIGSKSVNYLAKELDGRVEKLTIIGDAVKPCKVMDAVKDAYDAAISCHIPVSAN